MNILHIYNFPCNLAKIQRYSHIASKLIDPTLNPFLSESKAVLFPLGGDYKVGGRDRATLTLNKKPIVENVKLQS